LSEDWGANPGGDAVSVPHNVGTEGRDHNNVGFHNHSQSFNILFTFQINIYKNKKIKKA